MSPPAGQSNPGPARGRATCRCPEEGGDLSAACGRPPRPSPPCLTEPPAGALPAIEPAASSNQAAGKRESETDPEPVPDRTPTWVALKTRSARSLWPPTHGLRREREAREGKWGPSSSKWAAGREAVGGRARPAGCPRSPSARAPRVCWAPRRPRVWSDGGGGRGRSRWVSATGAAGSQPAVRVVEGLGRCVRVAASPGALGSSPTPDSCPTF